MRELLEGKGFSLNSYPEGKFWELTVEDDEEMKIHICKSFSASIDFCSDGTDIDTLILQCAEDYTRCIFYYDCNSFDMETGDFMECVARIRL